MSFIQYFILEIIRLNMIKNGGKSRSSRWPMASSATVIFKASIPEITQKVNVAASHRYDLSEFQDEDVCLKSMKVCFFTLNYVYNSINYV